MPTSWSVPVPGGYDVRDGVHYERLIVFEAVLSGA